MTDTILSRMLKLAKLRSITVVTSSGAEPDTIIEFEDCHQVYGDTPNIIPMFKEVRTRCMHPARYPNDCIYDATAQGEEYRRCKYCRKLTG